MTWLETATLVGGTLVGLGGAGVTDTQVGSMSQCLAYLEAQANRYQVDYKPGQTQLKIRYRVLGDEFLVTRTCIETKVD